MNWSLPAILTMAICIAISIIAVMMTLGAMGASTGIRNAGIFVACAVGVLLGQHVYKTYFAK